MATTTLSTTTPTTTTTIATLQLQHYTKESFITKGSNDGSLYILTENGTIVWWDVKKLYYEGIYLTESLPFLIPPTFLKMSFGAVDCFNGRMLLWSHEGILLWFSLSDKNGSIFVIDLGVFSVLLGSLLLDNSIVNFVAGGKVIVTSFEGEDNEYLLPLEFSHPSKIIKRLPSIVAANENSTAIEEHFLIFSGAHLMIITFKNGKLCKQSNISKLILNCEKEGYFGDEHAKFSEFDPYSTSSIRLVECVSNFQEKFGFGSVAMSENVSVDSSCYDNDHKSSAVIVADDDGFVVEDGFGIDSSVNMKEFYAFVSVSSGDMFKVTLSLSASDWEITEVEHISISKDVFISLHILRKEPRNNDKSIDILGDSFSNGKCFIKMMMMSDAESENIKLSYGLPSVLSEINSFTQRSSFKEYIILTGDNNNNAAAGDSAPPSELWSMRQCKRDDAAGKTMLTNTTNTTTTTMMMMSLNCLQSDPTIMRGVTALFAVKHFNSDLQNSLLICSFVEKTVIFYHSSTEGGHCLSGCWEAINDRIEGLMVLEERTLACANVLGGRSSIIQVTPSTISLFRLPTDLTSVTTSSEGQPLSSLKSGESEFLLCRIKNDRIYCLSRSALNDRLCIYEVISDVIVVKEVYKLAQSISPIPAMAISSKGVAITIGEKDILFLSKEVYNPSKDDGDIDSCNNDGFNDRNSKNNNTINNNNESDSQSNRWAAERTLHCRSIVSDIRFGKQTLIVGYYNGEMEEFDLQTLHPQRCSTIHLGCRPVTFPLIEDYDNDDCGVSGNLVLSDGLFHYSSTTLEVQSLSSRCDYLVRWSPNSNGNGNGGGGRFISVEHETLKVFDLVCAKNTSEMMFPLLERKGMYSYVLHESCNFSFVKGGVDRLLITASRDHVGNSILDLYLTPGVIDDTFEACSPSQKPLHLGKIPSIDEGYSVKRMKLLPFKGGRLLLILGFEVAEGVGQVRVFSLCPKKIKSHLPKPKSPHTNPLFIAPSTPSSPFSKKKSVFGGGASNSFTVGSFPFGTSTSSFSALATTTTTTSTAATTTTKDCHPSLLTELASIGLPSPVTDLVPLFCSDDTMFILTSCRNELHLLMLEEDCNVVVSGGNGGIDNGGFGGGTTTAMTLTNYSSSVNHWNSDIDCMVESPSKNLVAISTKMGGLELLTISSESEQHLDGGENGNHGESAAATAASIYNPGTGSLSMLLNNYGTNNNSNNSNSNNDNSLSSYNISDDSVPFWSIRRVWCEERRADSIQSLKFITDDIIGACDDRGYVVLYYFEKEKTASGSVDGSYDNGIGIGNGNSNGGGKRIGVGVGNVTLKRREYHTVKGIPKSICKGGLDDCCVIYTTYSGEIGSISLKK